MTLALLLDPVFSVFYFLVSTLLLFAAGIIGGVVEWEYVWHCLVYDVCGAFDFVLSLYFCREEAWHDGVGRFADGRPLLLQPKKCVSLVCGKSLNECLETT